MSSLGKVVRSGIGRRRVQTVVIQLSAFMAVTAAVLGGSLLVASTAPFDKAFAEQHGAHLSVLIDAARATQTQSAATAEISGVSESSGPYAVVTAAPELGPGSSGPAGIALRPLTIAGRDEPSQGVDRVSILDGRWATGPGEIVLTEGPAIGSTLVFADRPGKPSFTVVGRARSVSRTADAWVTPPAITALEPTGYQMLYRLSASALASDVDTVRSAVTAALPADTVLGSQSWLTTKQAADRTTALFVPFLIAFGLLGLVMAVLSVGSVIAGAVGAGTYRIGVLKALGFTPAQVVRAYLAQALIPAGLGIGLGVVAGNLLTIPVLRSASDVYETTPSGVAPWVDIVVVSAAVAVVTATAWAASWRAGRLRTVDALAVGRTPAAGRGRLAAALSARLPLPRPVSLGLAQPFARPARMIAMVATVVFGTAAVALAVGLAASLGRVEVTRSHDSAGVMVDGSSPPGSGPGTGSGPASGSGPRRPGPPDPLNENGPEPATVLAAIASQPGTEAAYGIAEVPAAIAGLSGTIDLLGFTDDPSWAGFELTEGRWFHGTGEALAPTPLLTATAAKIGDTITVVLDDQRVPIRIVGEVFSTENDGLQLFTDLRTLTAVQPKLKPREYRVAVADGVGLDGYITALDKAMEPFGLNAQPNPGGHSDVLVALNTLTGLLTVLLVAVAALGVLNAVVLQTRERVRELGVHKAMGMTPRQAIMVVLSSVVLIGLIGGVLGVPAGMALHSVMVPAMGDTAGVRLPQMVLDVWGPVLLVLLGLGGIVIAVAGALLPAGWAARIRTATALRTE